MTLAIHDAGGTIYIGGTEKQLTDLEEAVRADGGKELADRIALHFDETAIAAHTAAQMDCEAAEKDPDRNTWEEKPPQIRMVMVKPSERGIIHKATGQDLPRLGTKVEEHVVVGEHVVGALVPVPCAIGVNLPFNGGNDPNGNRVLWLSHYGIITLRGNANTPANAASTIFSRTHCYTSPMTESTGFQAFANSFFNADGSPKPGFSGVLEILNESYGTWASSLASAGGGAYWDAISSDVIALKAKHGDKLKIIVVAQPPGTPNGGSTPKVSTWLADMVARAQSHGHDIGKLIHGVAWHGYQQGQAGFAKNSSGAYVYPSHPWSLKAFDDFFKAHGLLWVVYNTECGAGMHGTSGDASFSLDSQKQFYQNACDFARNPNNWIPGLTPGIYRALQFYCLLNGGTVTHQDAGGFGIIEQSNFSQGPPNANNFHPAVAVLVAGSNAAKAAGATGNFNTGAVTPPPVDPPPVDPPPVEPPPATGQLKITLDPADSTKVIFDAPVGTAGINVWMADSDGYPLPAGTYEYKLIPANPGQTSWHPTRMDVTKKPVWVDGIAMNVLGNPIGGWAVDHQPRVKVSPAVTPPPPATLTGGDQRVMSDLKDTALYQSCRIVAGSVTDDGRRSVEWIGKDAEGKDVPIVRLRMTNAEWLNLLKVAGVPAASS